MEIVEAPAAQPNMRDPGFEAFRSDRRAALETVVIDVNGAGSYVNTSGQAIRFIVNDSESTILDINGVGRRGFATRGNVINADGNGRAVISSPWSAVKVIIDYSDWNNPLRGEVP
jgi:hypothetical protein